MGFSRKQNTLDFPKNEHFLPPDTHKCVCGKTYSFFGKFSVLSFLETPVLRFALLPYYRRNGIELKSCNQVQTHIFVKQKSLLQIISKYNLVIIFWLLRLHQNYYMKIEKFCLSCNIDEGNCLFTYFMLSAECFLRLGSISSIVERKSNL